MILEWAIFGNVVVVFDPQGIGGREAPMKDTKPVTPDATAPPSTSSTPPKETRAATAASSAPREESERPATELWWSNVSPLALTMH